MRSSTPAPAPTETAPGTEIRNDLAAGSAKRRLHAGSVAVDVTYRPRLSVERWTATANKPLEVTLTARAARSSQKIYLTRATVVITPRDDAGILEAPKPISDGANISPGFYVSRPFAYGQTFLVPALPYGSRSVTLEFTYELLLQTAKGSKDYYKQTATDSIVVPVLG